MAPSPSPEVTSGPLGPLPELDGRQVRLEGRLARQGPVPLWVAAIDWLTNPIGLTLQVGPPEISWRAAGLQRPGVIAQFAWPRLATRVAIGIETPLAHAIIDRLLGFERFDGEERLQVTPVEWGILAFALARTLDRQAERPGALGAWDLFLDRVGPEPFKTSELGPIITLRWPCKIGRIEGSLRLWVEESLAARWLSAEPAPRRTLTQDAFQGKLGELSSDWRAETGTVALRRGLRSLRAGGVLPIHGAPLRGTPQSPRGPVLLTLRETRFRWVLIAEPEPESGGGRLIVHPPPRRESCSREIHVMSEPADPSPSVLGAAPNSPVDPLDIPVTLTVELGRISLPLARLADLKAGDVVELGRHPREPVELTSGGRLVARGELVQIDTELGVRVTSVFL